jgi:hypothetical protein
VTIAVARTVTGRNALYPVQWQRLSRATSLGFDKTAFNRYRLAHEGKVLRERWIGGLQALPYEREDLDPEAQKPPDIPSEPRDF